MTSAAKHTAGPVKVRGRTVMTAHGVKIASAAVHNGGSNFKSEDVAEANGHLIAEAFNVAHETGLTPRQLADRCAKLEVFAQAVIEALCTRGLIDDDLKITDAGLATLARCSSQVEEG